MESFVCAFRGRRDAYQAPLALEEGGLLDMFITDIYATPWISRFASLAPAATRVKLARRSEPGISPNHVRCLLGTAIVESSRHLLGFSPELTYKTLDPEFSRAAAKRAAETRSSLFLYSPYAWEAFVARYRYTPRKVLFQYHPHPRLEQRLLADDGLRYRATGESSSAAVAVRIPEHLASREWDAWKHADLIVCASTFTRQSLLEAGADEKVCRVVPYGVETPTISPQTSKPENFHVAFVGSGSPRKGLHHLLMAWRKAALPESSSLTLVCRVIDPELNRMAIETPRTKIVRGLAQPQLDALYADSTLFAMPSLVEGFGQVYLEALARGCPVLGTANTCLPDLGSERNGIFLSTPGNIDELAGTLERLARMLPGNSALRDAARECAEKYTWPAFRNGLREILAN